MNTSEYHFANGDTIDRRDRQGSADVRVRCTCVVAIIVSRCEGDWRLIAATDVAFGSR